MRSGTLINDWGWQLHTITRAPDGNWTAPAIFSHDVGLPDEPPRLAATGAGEAMLIYHACSFDAMRSVIHGNRIHLAVLRAAPAAATGVHAPLPPRAVEPANRPRLATRPVTEAAGERLGCYWGDLHRHSHVSKCIPEHDGGFADHARFAVSVRGFDFYSLTDHDTQISDREWEQWLGRCDCLSEAGSMIVIPGFEGPNHTVQGHVNVYFRDREAAAFGYRGMRHLATLPEMYEACRRAGMVNRVVFIRHFHADALRHADLLQGPGVFNPAFNWAMEVVQGRGYSPKTTRILLDAGFRFGFVGGSDHNRPPGHPRGGVGIYEQAITGIWSTVLDSQALFESLRLRRTFCTNGPLLGAAIRVNDTFMGGCAPKRAVQAIRIDIQPTTRLQSVALLRDGQPVAQRTLQAEGPVSLDFEDAPGDDAAHAYYAVIEQTPEPGLDYPGIAWTSPVWVD